MFQKFNVNLSNLNQNPQSNQNPHRLSFLEQYLKPTIFGNIRTLYKDELCRYSANILCMMAVRCVHLSTYFGCNCTIKITSPTSTTYNILNCIEYHKTDNFFLSDSKYIFLGTIVWRNNCENMVRLLLCDIMILKLCPFISTVSCHL